MMIEERNRQPCMWIAVLHDAFDFCDRGRLRTSVCFSVVSNECYFWMDDGCTARVFLCCRELLGVSISCKATYVGNIVQIEVG